MTCPLCDSKLRHWIRLKGGGGYEHRVACGQRGCPIEFGAGKTGEEARADLERKLKPIQQTMLNNA